MLSFWLKKGEVVFAVWYWREFGGYDGDEVT